MDIYIVGSINMDLVIHTDKMPELGETITGYGFGYNPGGKGANQAVAVGKLGKQSKMVACVGNEFGADLLKSLNQYNVDTQHVKLDAKVSSGIAVITVVGGDNQIILDAGANYSLNKDDIDKFLNVAKAGDYVIFQMEILPEVMEYALKLSSLKGLITVLNPAPARTMSSDFYQYCDYFIINQSECEFFTGKYPNNYEESLESAQILKNQGVKNVLITLGSKGSVFSNNETSCFKAAYPQKAVDTTAAGDTFIGAFILKISEGVAIEAAMDFASAAAGLTVTRQGAQQAIPYKDEVLEFLDKQKH